MATPELDPESACGVSPAQFCAKRWPASMFAEVVRHAKSAGRWEEQRSVQLPVMTLLGGPSGVGSSFDSGNQYRFAAVPCRSKWRWRLCD